MSENLEQRSTEWHAWRRQGIGSSDSSVLMGCNDYKTVTELWEEKIGIRQPPNIINADMQRGIDNEDLALALYALTRTDRMEFQPITITHPDYPFLRASLDGANIEHKCFVEIKCPRPYTHAKTKQHQTIKPEYFCQMQHQYLTTGFLKCDFISLDVETEDLVIVPIAADEFYMAELFERECLFWDHVMSRIPPNPRDFYLFSNVRNSSQSCTTF